MLYPNTCYKEVSYKKDGTVFTFHNKSDLDKVHVLIRERSGSAVECLTRDRRAVGSSLTGVTVLCP